MWIEVSEGNWLNVSKVGRVWVMDRMNSLDDYKVCACVDGTTNVIYVAEELSEARRKVRTIMDICLALQTGSEGWKQSDAAPLER